MEVIVELINFSGPGRFNHMSPNLTFIFTISSLFNPSRPCSYGTLKTIYLRIRILIRGVRGDVVNRLGTVSISTILFVFW